MPSPGAVKAAQRRLIAIFLCFCIASGLLILVGITWMVPRPNVILVTLGTTRADHLGAYGYRSGMTGSFDEFSQYGALFERAYTPVPATLPSHATMLTGLYPPEHGLRVNGEGRLGNEVPILSEILKEKGYDTGAFIAAAVLGSQYGLNRGFDTYDDVMARKETRGQFVESRRDATEIMKSALAWMKQRNKRPFFCWIHLDDAHAPYDARLDKFGNKFIDQQYDAGIAQELQEFERLTKYLKDSKLSGNTLVVITADHGEGLDEHLETDHGMFVYNTTLHVPLVFVYPRSIPPSTRVQEVVSLVDLTPTVLDVLRLPPLNETNGRSLFPALKGRSLASRDVYAETEAPFLDNHWSPLHALISDRWKYIQTTKPELYDLSHDPGELNNLIDAEPQEASEMKNRLERMEKAFVTRIATEVNLSQKDRANLLTLGYHSSGTSAGSQIGSMDNATRRDVKEMLPLLAKFDKARFICAEGKLDEGVTLLQQIVQETTEFPAANFLLASCLAQANRLDEATRVYRNLLVQRPDFPVAHLHLGRIAIQQGDMEKAVAEFSEFVNAAPNSATGHFELAAALAQAGKSDDAIAQYNETIRIAPGFAAASIALGQLYMTLNRLEDAQGVFERAIEYEPRSVEAHTNLSMTLAQLKQFDKALDHARMTVTLAPQSFESRFNFGSLLISQGQYAEGISQLREAQKLRPDDPRPRQQIQQAESLQRNSK